MARSDGLDEALTLLLDTRATSRGPSRLLASDEAMVSTDIDIRASERVPESQLAKRVAEADSPWAIVVTSKLSAQLVRAIRRAPPGLLIVVGKASAAERERLHALQTDGVRVLGPNAAVRRGDGAGLRCAGNPDELAGLLRSTAPFRLALAPTPAWLLSWLDSPALGDAPPLGYVTGDGLYGAWATW
ncbi:MAG: hypothetical protein ACPHRO_10675, partial [Nannocystaceae bacterium]